MTDSRKAQEIIHNHALAAAGLGIPGSFIPMADMSGMAVIWGKMILELAAESRHAVDGAYATKLATSVVSGVTLYVGGSKAITWLLHFILPGAGTLTVVAINALFNWIYTLRLGKLIAQHFEQPGFHPDTLWLAAKGFAALVFALPTLDEFKEAFGAIGHLLG
jgi:uncharacterized protein (DUF697 family)